MATDKVYSQSGFRGQIHCPAPVTPFSPAAEQKQLRRILIEAGCLEGPVAKRA